MKKFICILLIAVLTLSMAACSKEKESQDTASKTTEGESNSANSETETKELFKIKAYGEIDPQVSAQQIIAKEMGYFEEEGLEVENILLSGPSERAALVASGDAKLSFQSTYNNISLAANGVEIALLAPLANAGGTQSVVARGDLKITSAKDLEGMKIGMTSGAGVYIAIRRMCDELGVDINKIEFVTLQAADQIAALERGDIDAMACWEPWVGKAIDNGGQLLFSGFKSNLPEKKGDVHWIDFHMTVQTTKAFYDENPEQVAAVLRALNKATTYINENRHEAAEIIAGKINLEVDECERIMGNNVYSMEFNQEFVDGTNTMANFMMETGNIDAVPDFYSYSYPEALEKVLPDLVTIEK
ncbi:ABC transporter substrate-binding protein [Anaerosacchariphilus polymeriproducens]|uniref:ABC transporter substrate-binding protein n=1 Tax=Anaerosacchariphilus polymeriproducens TaxID=1812858 RepID=A0A371AWY0_9FIRM|nr:ABC transporter substrate-binding protein [Anaerosacchariphilus polymeriproducens]RDU24094.1 ABC transporter substrate-binding protein [Anaerosacchariphilus polymeriproducens]